MRTFICWYAYQGMETEGNVQLQEPAIFDAKDEIEAMWKYHQKLGTNEVFDKRFPTLEDFREKCEFITGWGFNCREIVK